MLPSQSAYLLPNALGSLMTGTLADLYPTEYGTIPDEKGREWRDIAKIPFVEESRLLEAYAEAVATGPLSPSEAGRNALLNAVIYTHAKDKAALLPAPGLSRGPRSPSLRGSGSRRCRPRAHGCIRCTRAVLMPRCRVSRSRCPGTTKRLCSHT